ncbi:nitrate ABC transporter substrate-binding protein [Demequina sp. NBRC 110055]|uniref:nitrate ABC transporter substrate-binding protein n=1 Tax=Demequina sp. NBRC 110055 TaxID=1570344 RepID=UPI0009FD5ECB|nr:nitrate ABC transporter substrate-binding protein [Demequina sp. NBRC 110055]
MRVHFKSASVIAGLAATAVTLSACSSDAEPESSDAPESSATSSATASASAGGLDLSAVCPADIKIQTDWNPEMEHGHLYALLGDEYEVDSDNKSVTGPLMASGEPTGVDVTILSGGPAVGFAQPNAQLYSDTSIFMAYVGTDEAIAHSTDLPTVSVFQPLEKDPQMIMWDPETYPDVTGIADLGTDGTTVRVFPGGVYIDYFVGAGILSADQIDTTYDGTPAVFVSESGAIAQQGFASAEPFIYENEVDAWGKPVGYELINDAGFPKYAASMSLRPDDVTEYADCLELLVPVMQQAEVDYYDGTLKDSVKDLVLELVDAYDTGWVYSAEVADYSFDTMIADGIASDGPDGVLGTFDADRVAELFEIVEPIYGEQGIDIAEGLTPEDLYTNEFIDESISLGF